MNEFEERKSGNIETDMSRSLPQKIRAIRRQSGLNQAAFGHELGVSQSQVSKWEKPFGERPTVDNLMKIAKFAQVAIDDLIDYPIEKSVVPLIGYVTAGAEMILFAESQGPFDEVAAPEGATETTVAVEVRGTSLGDIFNGWLVFYDERRCPPADDLVGKLCVIGLTDGRVVVKKLQRGQLRGRFNLLSATEPPIYDAEIDWVAKVTHLSQDR